VSTIDPLYLSEASLEGLLQQVGKGQVQHRLESNTGRSRATLRALTNYHKPSNNVAYRAIWGVLWRAV
jgi:hypothetical protein